MRLFISIYQTYIDVYSQTGKNCVTAFHHCKCHCLRKRDRGVRGLEWQQGFGAGM